MRIDRPGYQSRRNKDGSIAHYWNPKRAVKDAPTFLKIIRLPDGILDDEISRVCVEKTEALKLDLETYDVPPEYDGTLKSAIRLYMRDPTSTYHSVKHHTRVHDYGPCLRLLERTVGDRRIEKLKASDFKRWFEKWREHSHRTASGAIKLLRIVLSYGSGERLDGCAAVRGILSSMKFEQPPARKVFMTYQQCASIVAKSAELECPSIGFVEALKFETALRRIDVIGEWSPQKEGGPFKWEGLMADSISKDLILSIETSKTGTPTSHDLKRLPLVVEALKAYKLPQTGPVVINESTGKPYWSNRYSQKFRTVSNAAGVPAHIWSMDSRAGAITETICATGTIEAAQKLATHSNPRTTSRYNRGDGLNLNRTIAADRLKMRK